MSRASSLFRLQRQDQELDAARIQLSSVETEIHKDGGLNARRGRVQTAGQALQEARAAHAHAENEVAVLRAKLEATESTLYGGSVHNPKELADLQQETIALRKHLSTLEDRLLEIMLALESAEETHHTAEADLRSGEGDWSDARQALERTQSAVLQLISRLEGEREATMASVPEADLALYESLRKAHGGTAVAEILEASCGGCGVAVAPSIIQIARNSPDLVRCRQCNRILYAG